MNDEQLLNHYRNRFNLAVNIWKSLSVNNPQFLSFTNHCFYYSRAITFHRLMTGSGSPKTEPVIGIETNVTYKDLLNQINNGTH